MEAVSQMNRINIYTLQPLFHFQSHIVNRPVQAGAGADGPILRL